MTVPRDSLGFLIADVSRLMRKAFERAVAGTGLTLAQARALVYVKREQGARQVDLAELLEVQPITLARLLDHLEGAGLVERRPDPEDRRAHRIHLTSKAAGKLAAIEEAAARVRAHALRGLPRAQATALLTTLGAIRDNLGAPARTRQP